MIDPAKVQLVRSVAHAVYGVDIANRGNSPTLCYPRNVAIMALHDEFGFTQTEAAAVFGGVPARFTYARQRLIEIFAQDAKAREQDAEFLRVLDREMEARRILEAMA